MDSEEKSDQQKRAQASTLVFVTLVIFNLLPNSYWQGRIIGNAVLIFLLMPGWLHMASVIFCMQQRYKLMAFCASNAVFMARILNLIPGNPLSLNLHNYMQTEISALILLEETQDAIKESYELIGFLEKYKPTYRLSIAKAKVLLGTALSVQGEYSKSESVMKEAIHEMESSDADPRQIAATLADVAATHSKMGKMDAALEAGNKAIKMQERLLANETNPFIKKQETISLGMILNNTASCFEEAGEEAEALELYKKSLDIKLEAFGELSREAATGYTNLGYTHLCAGNTEEGAEYCIKARKIGEEINLARKNHRIWSAVLCNSGNAYCATGDLAAAEIDLIESLLIRQKYKSPQKHETMLELGKLYRELRRFDESKKYFDETIKYRESAFGFDHPILGKALREYLELCKMQNAETEVLETENRLKRIRNRKR